MEIVTPNGIITLSVITGTDPELQLAAVFQFPLAMAVLIDCALAVGVPIYIGLVVKAANEGIAVLVACGFKIMLLVNVPEPAANVPAKAAPLASVMVLLAAEVNPNKAPSPLKATAMVPVPNVKPFPTENTQFELVRVSIDTAFSV